MRNLSEPTLLYCTLLCTQRRNLSEISMSSYLNSMWDFAGRVFGRLEEKDNTLLTRFPGVQFCGALVALIA
jgi:hypothetical protein